MTQQAEPNIWVKKNNPAFFRVQKYYPKHLVKILKTTQGAVGGSVLAQGHLSRGIEGGESAGYSLPHQQSLPDPRFEPTTFGLQVQLSNY